MKDEPNEISANEDDADFELTQLEWESSQRELSAAETARLAELRKDSAEVVRDVADRMAPPETGNPVVDGDDSP